MKSIKGIPKDVMKVLKKNGIIKVLKLIDCGSTAHVYKARMKDSETEEVSEVAVKLIDMNKVSDKEKEKYIPREINIVQNLRHENILKTYKVIEYKERFVFLITVLANGGDLMSILETESLLEESKVKLWFTEIVSAVEYMHSKGIAHRDIKADNILVHNDHMMLADFGYSRVSVDPDGAVSKCMTTCGTLEYQSPEALAHKRPFNPLVSDCFSLGVLLFTMITQYFPFGGGDDIRTAEGRKQLLEDISNQHWSLPEPMNNNENLYSLLKQLLNPDPYARVRSCQIQSHPWFKK